MTASSSSATLSDASVFSLEPVSASFEEMTPATSPFIDRLGRFKRGTYRAMLIETGMPYDSAKIMANQAAEQHKIDRAFSKSMPLANSAHPEIPASNTNSEITASVSDFDEIEYFDQMVSNGVDPETAADIARKTAIARRRDPLERATRYKIRRRMPDPVHRDSYEVGEREKSVWKPVNPQEIGAYLEAVDQYSI
ncbi:MAG: helix-turn-helix domain-containing protein, partial [Zymomonas mobilis]